MADVTPDEELDEWWKYIVIDKGGTRGQRPRGHSPQRCGTCKFVEDRKHITPTSRHVYQAELTSFRRLLIRLRLSGEEDYLVFLGYYILPGWTHHNAWYLFQCTHCGIMTKDYCSGRARLACGACGAVWRLSQRPKEASDGLRVW